MKLSAPVYRLKRQAKILSREEDIPLHEALDRIATKEGYPRWSMLARQMLATAPASAVGASLVPGDMLLLGARPGHGKTQFSLQLTVDAMKSGYRAIFFTLEYNAPDILELFRSIGEDPSEYNDRFEFDASDGINAGYIKTRLSTAPAGTIAVVDYLQLLDQKRENPELMEQIRALKSFVLERSLIMVFISQIDRSYDSTSGVCPGLDDVRLPNPLDLKLFNKTCFLNDGVLQISEAS